MNELCYAQGVYALGGISPREYMSKGVYPLGGICPRGYIF